MPKSLGSQGIKNYIKKSHDESLNSLNKTKNSELELAEKQQKLLNTQYVSKTYSKLEPKGKIEMIKSSANRGDLSGSSENYQVAESSDPESSGLDNKRNSVEDESSQVVPKIEISLNECFNKKRSHETSHQVIKELKYAQNEQSEQVVNQKFDDSSLNRDLIAYIKNSSNQLDEEVKSNSRYENEEYDSKHKDSKNSQKREGYNRKTGVTCKSRPSLEEKRKVEIANDPKMRSIDSMGMPITKNIESRTRSKNEISQTFDNSDLLGTNKDEIVKTLSKKIKDCYLKNNAQGKYEHK